MSAKYRLAIDATKFGGDIGLWVGVQNYAARLPLVGGFHISQRIDRAPKMSQVCGQTRTKRCKIPSNDSIAGRLSSHPALCHTRHETLIHYSGSG